MKVALSFLLAFGIGFGCRVANIPLPAPPVIIGALLVCAMTVGYALTDKFASAREHKNKHLCGGPSGESVNKKME